MFSIMSLNFPSFSKSERPYTFADLTSEQLQSLLDTTYGLTEYLAQHFPDRIKKGTSLKAWGKALYAWEHGHRRCHIADIASALDVTEATANQLVTEIRTALQQVFHLRVTSGSGIVALADSEALKQDAERLEIMFHKIRPTMDRIKQTVSSLNAQGQPIAIAPGDPGYRELLEMQAISQNLLTAAG